MQKKITFLFVAFFSLNVYAANPILIGARYFIFELAKDLAKEVTKDAIKMALGKEPTAKNDIKKLNQDISTLKDIVLDLKNTHGFSVSEISPIENTISNVSGILSELEKRISSVENKINSHENRIQELERSNRLLNEKVINLEALYSPNISTQKADRWFVILGSYPKSEKANAYERQRYLKSLRYVGVSLQDTDNYPNLRKGLIIVTIGPLSKEYAIKLKDNLISVISDVYVKAGW